MNEHARERVGAARKALLSRLEQLLPGDGELTVDTRHMHGELVFCCRRSTRLGFVCVAVPGNLNGQDLTTRVLDELADTQLDALEPL